MALMTAKEKRENFKKLAKEASAYFSKSYIEGRHNSTDFYYEDIGSFKKVSFSKGFLTFLEEMKQVRFDLQSNQIEPYGAFERMQELEEECKLPHLSEIDGFNISIDAHIERMNSFIRIGIYNHSDKLINIIGHTSDPYSNSSDRESDLRQARTKLNKSFKALAERMNPQTPAIAEFVYNDFENLVVSKLKEAFEEAGLHVGKDNSIIIEYSGDIAEAANCENLLGRIIRPDLLPQSKLPKLVSK